MNSAFSTTTVFVNHCKDSRISTSSSPIQKSPQWSLPSAHPPAVASVAVLHELLTHHSPHSVSAANTGAVRFWVPVARKLSVLIKLIGVAEDSVMSTLGYNQDLALSNPLHPVHLDSDP
ncbi:hypothetical protein ElyMa_000315100 [Elysia marginata]|uniref:Uncharacterized protein n=1 Tax=Elysia marginata TaxID=1093978 RepID=A0AAV4F9C3_9GAST|nr:hypothetical protein ElyMa_000315100 [Elysia marginata]